MACIFMSKLNRWLEYRKTLKEYKNPERLDELLGKMESKGLIK